MSTIIQVAWRTDVMKASAFAYYHQGCYTGQQFTNDIITELDESEILTDRMCDECNETLCEVEAKIA